MFKKNNFIVIILILSVNFIFADCGNFSIKEDYFADHLIGFYLNSIDIETGDSNVEYFRYRIKNENQTINDLEAHYSLIINSPDLNLSNFEMMSGIVNIKLK